MTVPALVDEALFWSLAAMTLLLVMFVWAVVVAPPAGAAPAHAPSPELAPPDPEPPAGRSQPPALPAGASGAGFVATQATAPAPLPSRPVVSSEPPRAMRVGIAGLALTGAALAVIGGLLFLRRVHGAVACSHHASAICLDGFVLLTAAQVIGAAIALAGIALFFTAVVLALR